MNNKPFVLNHTFWVFPQLGLIKQKLPAKETRIEPRLMNLLCLLILHNGELVGRELLTKKVWDDYGNAGESLTQAISYLRKVLNDDAKQLIETVPKKGYVLHAIITNESIDGENEQAVASDKKKVYLIAAVVVLLALIAVYFIFKQPAKSKYPADVIRGEQFADTSAKKGLDVQANKKPQSNPDKLSDTIKNADQAPPLKK